MGAGDLRLAIECHGDEFHGPERWPRDMARQRVLERVGWTFWRCFASTWQLRKQEVLAELIEQLSGLGIEPLGALERVPLLVERREVGAAVISNGSVNVWVQPAEPLECGGERPPAKTDFPRGRDES